MPVTIEALQKIPMFSMLDREDLTQIAAITVERRYGRGDMILLEGDMEGGLYYVYSGLVKLFKTSTSGREQVIRLIAPGNTFNDVPAFDGGPNPVSAAAVEPGIIYVMERAELRKLMLSRPKVAEAVVRTLASALRHLVMLVEDLSLRNVTARVAKILLDQTTAPGHAHQLTQQEMAALAGTAREVVGRSLKELEAAGAIEMRQGRAQVTNLERLRILAAV